MRMTKKLYKACSTIFKDLDCTRAYDSEQCPVITDCEKCEFYVSDEDFNDAYNVLKEELEKNKKE